MAGMEKPWPARHLRVWVGEFRGLHL